MGLAALRKILHVAPLDPAALCGRVVAVDADNLVWAFATAMGAGEPPRGPHGHPVGHLIGLVSRLRLYAGWGVRSAWVFDGPQPALKGDTLAGRESRAQATGAAWIGQRELDECKDVLTALGVPWMVAPAESDAQCAHLVRDGVAWCAVTQDYDAALHGTPRTARNLSVSKTRQPELLDLDASLAKTGLTLPQLVDVAILVGTDYNVGVRGVGPVKAVKLVKQHGDAEGALAALGTQMPALDEVRALFLDHAVDRAWRPRFSPPDAEATRRVLALHGLSAARAEAVAAALGALHAG